MKAFDESLSFEMSKIEGAFVYVHVGMKLEYVSAASGIPFRTYCFYGSFLGFSAPNLKQFNLSRVSTCVTIDQSWTKVCASK